MVVYIKNLFRSISQKQRATILQWRVFRFSEQKDLWYTTSLYKNSLKRWKYIEKNAGVYIRFSTAVMLKMKSWKNQEQQNNILNGPFMVKQTFM